MDEIALVTAAFKSMGWIVRSASKSEARGYPVKNRTWLVVEVRFNGYPRTAPKVAVKLIDEVIEKLQLGAWVRYAEIVSFSQEPEKTYYIDEIPAGWLTGHWPLSRALKLVGIPRTTGLIRLPADTQETEVRAGLARYDLGNPFDPSRNLIRPVIPDFLEKANKVAAPKVPPLFNRLTGLAALVLAFIFGAVNVWVSDAWKAIPVLVAIAMMIPLALSIPDKRTLTNRFCIGFIYTGAFTLAGATLASKITNHKPSTFFGLIAITGALALMGRGVFLALGGSGLTRHVSWLFPLVVTALVPFVLALGGIFDTEYLTYGFGIPANTVSVPAVLRLAVAGRSILIGFAVVLLVLAIIGWVRYFHGFDAYTRVPMLLTAITITAFYLLTSISTGLSWVYSAAQSAAAQARAGRQPSDYFGLQGVLECIRPVNPSIPVYNGPLPVHRPILSFGTTGAQLWVWDPGSAQAISVPLQNVVATPATGTPAHC